MKSANEQQEDLSEIFAQVKDIDEQTLDVIIKILSKQKNQDCIGYLSNNGNQKYFEYDILQRENLTQVEKQQRLYIFRNNIQQIINFMKKIKDHDFNKQDYSTERYLEQRQNLIKIRQCQKELIEFLKFLVHLTAQSDKLIQCGSNSLNLLVEMKVVLSHQKFEKIRIKNTSLIGANFVRCDLSESQFENVDISGMNLNGAQLFNCKWTMIKILELNKLDGHSSSVKSVCFSPDGTTLASGSQDNSIRLWNFKTGQQIAKFDGHTCTVQSICFSSDGTSLASGSNDQSICLWDVKTRKKFSKLDGHTSAVNSVCFSPDGTKLASGSYDNSIRLWDVKTGQQKSKLNGRQGWVISVCFSPDGTILASCGSYIHLWDIKTGQQKSQLYGHSNYVYSVCFSLDGTTLASGSHDKTIFLWDVKTGQQKSKLNGHSHYVNSVCFSPASTNQGKSFFPLQLILLFKQIFINHHMSLL